MRFLGNEAEGRNIMPLNFIYTNPRDDKDCLMILYKDCNTGEKFVKNIYEPEIYVHVVKEEYRGKAPTKDEPYNVDGSYRTDFLYKEQCDDIKVKYRSRMYAVAKILNIDPMDVNKSPYVAGTDITVEHWYFVEFLHEYANDLPKSINVGYFDIEADTTGFAKNELGSNHGKYPITVVTYISEVRKQIYVLVINNPDYGRMDEIVNNTSKLQDELIARFEPEFGTFEYNIIIFDKEIDLIAAFWSIVKAVEDDFIEAWNAPFDVGNLYQRPIELGYDPRSIISDKRFAVPVLEFEEDTSTFVAHKKRHKMKFTVPCIIDDMMRLYAGIRSGRSKLPSTKLEAIASAEGIGHKDEYTGDINEFLYRNFWDYIIYNVNDVLLMVGLGRKTRDTDDIYSRMLQSGILNTEVFISTTIWAQYIKNDVESKRGRYLCNNKNRYVMPTQEMVELGYNGDPDAVDDEEDEEDEDFTGILESIADQQNLIDKKTGKKKKFSGAIVLRTERARYTGTIINGIKSNHVHRHAIDQDITAEYPISLSITNTSNDTFVGKVYLDNPDDINLPFYGQYDFLDKEDAVAYRMNKGALMMETALQGDYLLAGSIALGLPEIGELEDLVAEMVKE